MSLYDQDPDIRVAPFIMGVASRDHVIIRRTDAPSYLCLSSDELKTTLALAKEPVRVSDYLGRHLSGQQILDFKAGIGLLLKLHQAGYIENTTSDMAARLREFAGRSAGQTATFVRRAIQGFT